VVKHFLMNASFLEAILRRDRAIIIAALAVLTALAWFDLVWLANDMAMEGMDMTGYRMIPAGQALMMPASSPWQPIEFACVFAMWVVMMIGMMTPSAAPIILVYARVGRHAVEAGRSPQLHGLRRLFAGVDRLFTRCDLGAMGP
jgi:predicted metal-binding membrane protein